MRGRSFAHSAESMPPSTIGISMDSPLRLSVMVMVSGTMPPRFEPAAGSRSARAWQQMRGSYPILWADRDGGERRPSRGRSGSERGVVVGARDQRFALVVQRGEGGAELAA